jgi:hypothetical protein
MTACCRYRLTNQELTDAYRRVTEQFKDLQLKVGRRRRPHCCCERMTVFAGEAF